MSVTTIATMHGTQPMADWMGWMMMGVMMLFWVLIISAIVVGLVLLVGVVRRSGSSSPAGGSGSQALDILEERFARGEIDRDEFEDRRRTLEG